MDTACCVTSKKKSVATELECETPTYGSIDDDGNTTAEGRTCCGADEKMVTLAHDETESPVYHVPNKLYVVVHVNTLHKIVRSKRYHFCEHTVVSSLSASDN